GMDIKWSEGSREHFPRLSVNVRPEIVTFGVKQLPVNEQGIVSGGQKLKPKQLHQLVKEKGSDLVFLDGRNSYEAAIGKFKDAVTPKVRHTRDFPKELKKP